MGNLLFAIHCLKYREYSSEKDHSISYSNREYILVMKADNE